MTDIIVQLDDKELPMVAIFSGYQAQVEVEVTTTVDAILDEDGNEVSPAHDVITHELQANPITLVQHITDYFNIQKDMFLKEQIKNIIKIETKNTEGKLENAIDDGPLYQAIKDGGLENLNAILRANV